MIFTENKKHMKSEKQDQIKKAVTFDKMTKAQRDNVKKRLKTVNSNIRYGIRSNSEIR